MSHSFFRSLARSQYFSIFSFSFWHSGPLEQQNALVIIIIIIIYSLEIFKSALADGLSLEFEWQQVSSSLQDSSQYSGRS